MGYLKDYQLEYKVKWVGYKDTTQELKENLKNAKKKIKEYYKKSKLESKENKGLKVNKLVKDNGGASNRILGEVITLVLTAFFSSLSL